MITINMKDQEVALFNTCNNQKRTRQSQDGLNSKVAALPEPRSGGKFTKNPKTLVFSSRRERTLAKSTVNLQKIKEEDGMGERSLSLNDIYTNALEAKARQAWIQDQNPLSGKDRKTIDLQGPLEGISGKFTKNPKTLVFSSRRERTLAKSTVNLQKIEEEDGMGERSLSLNDIYTNALEAKARQAWIQDQNPLSGKDRKTIDLQGPLLEGISRLLRRVKKTFGRS